MIQLQLDDSGLVVDYVHIKSGDYYYTTPRPATALVVTSVALFAADSAVVAVGDKVLPGQQLCESGAVGYNFA